MKNVFDPVFRLIFCIGVFVVAGLMVWFVLWFAGPKQPTNSSVRITQHENIVAMYRLQAAMMEVGLQDLGYTNATVTIKLQ